MSGPQSTDGLITRIGRWLDRRFQTKATQEELRYYWNQLENAQIKDKLEVLDKIKALTLQVNERIDLLRTPEGAEKDVNDLKTRLEKIELYSGMTRKVDPTKPPVVKSAFQM